MPHFLQSHHTTDAVITASRNRVPYRLELGGANHRTHMTSALFAKANGIGLAKPRCGMQKKLPGPFGPTVRHESPGAIAIGEAGAAGWIFERDFPCERRCHVGAVESPQCRRERMLRYRLEM